MSDDNISSPEFLAVTAILLLFSLVACIVCIPMIPWRRGREVYVDLYFGWRQFINAVWGDGTYKAPLPKRSENARMG